MRDPDPGGAFGEMISGAMEGDEEEPIVFDGEAYTSAITLEDDTMICCGPALLEFYLLWERNE